MASYTSLTRSQVEQIVAAYPLRLREVSPLPGGAANSSYLLHTDAARYVLTILDNHDLASATRLVALLEHLVAHDVPTSRPLRTRDGARLVSFADRPALVKEYVAGSCGEQLPMGGLAAAGSLLARVHAVPAPDWLPRDNRRLPGDWSTVAEEFADRGFADWLHRQHELASPVLRLPAPTGLVHGDLFSDNLVVRDDGNLSVLDWETAGNDLLLLDVGMAIVGLCRHESAFRPDWAADLLGGYQSLRPLSQPECDVLYQAVLYASLVIAYHRYRRTT